MEIGMLVKMMIRDWLLRGSPWEGLRWQAIYISKLKDIWKVLL